MSCNLFTVLVVTALVASPLSARAQTQAEQTSTKVFYGDLDLSKPAGMQTLQRRLKAASSQVCGNPRDALSVNTRNQTHCAQDAEANALAAIAKSQTRLLADNKGNR
ncbi:MAG TPA: UrcA family protein [Rhizomicrobium sp.]|nr:UrcA family protein [Rhizomicrobium sp.]